MSRIVTGGYRQAIDTVQRTLDTMNRLQGEMTSQPNGRMVPQSR
jgi:hypothetical protein